MKRRDMIKSLGLASAIPFLPWDIKGKAIEKPEVAMSGKSITIIQTGVYLLQASMVFENMGQLAKSYILIRRWNEKIPKVVTLFIRNGGKELGYISGSGAEVLDLTKDDIITIHLKPKYLNIKECYINCTML